VEVHELPRDGQTEAKTVHRSVDRPRASGYILKQSASDQLVHAIKRVAAGQAYLHPAITDQVVGGISAGGYTAHAARKLSNRENAVRCVALGFLTKEIATELNVSTRTVETHKANAMGKLGMKNRIDIVRHAMLQGWLQDT
jgi:two-component system response regulator NreC